ncbi:hypothetical protein BGZ94_005947 [Podila epigama]|nr:hypothetical protein BGZ94_005947 [Podila epigama]
MNTATSGPRSPQFFKPSSSTSSSAQNSDEILNGSIPQRPPRQNRQRSGSTSSPTMSGSQYFQHYQHPLGHAQQDPHHPHHQQQQYYTSSAAQSPRPSPRSHPNNAYGYPSQPPPPSPMSFQLPPSAFSSREDSLRSGSIPYPPNHNPSYHNSTQSIHHGSSSSASSYRSPHVSPGLPAGAMNMTNLPPLTLPKYFLEDQSDYAGYYSDVGIVSTPQLLPGHQHLTLQTTPMTTSSLNRQQPSPGADSNASGSRQNQRSGPIFLPSPHLTPTASPLMNDFANMSLGK